MKKILSFLAFIACQIASAQPTLTQFSSLANREIDLSTNITKISNGFLIQGIGVSVPMLYKLSDSGVVLDSMVVSYGGKFFYSDEIIRRGNLNYQLGYIYSNVPYTSPKRGLIIFDDNLKIIDTFQYNILPNNGFPNLNTSNTMIGDTIISVREYSRYDSAGIPMIPSRVTQIERIGLKGETYVTTNISDRVSIFTDAEVVKSRIFIFAYVASEASNINIQPVGEFLLDGTFVKTHPFNSNDPGGGPHGRIAILHKDMMYHAHDGSIDQRNNKFELVKRINLKNENSILSGVGTSYKAFSFDNKDNLFYLHGNQGTLTSGVFKLNAKLEVVWEKNMGVQGGILFVEKTNEGGCLVGYVQNQGNDIYTLRLYKLDDLGKVTAINDISLPTQKNLFYPNPFQSQLTLHETVEGASEVQLYDINGRIVGIFSIHNTTIEGNNQLPKGVYIAQLKDVKGSILGTQTIVKQ
jgi:hypothetical protein